jgi:hypothetical protein
MAFGHGKKGVLLLGAYKSIPIENLRLINSLCDEFCRSTRAQLNINYRSAQQRCVKRTSSRDRT